MSSWLISNLRSELRVHLGNLDTIDLPNSDADLLLNRAKWKIEEALELFTNQKHTTFSTTDGIIEYEQAFPIEAVEKLALNDTEQEKWIPLDPISEDDYNESYKTASDFKGKPTKYFRRGKYIILYPTPDNTYSIEVTRRELLDDLSDSVTALSMDKSLQEIILYQAVMYGFLRSRDFNAAFRMREVVSDLLKGYVIPKSKEQDWHQAQVVIITNKYNP